MPADGGIVLTRQFKQLANRNAHDRDVLLIDGLTRIGASVRALVDEWINAESIGAHRACKLVRNTAREEAGKFLLLLDHYRDPTATQAQRSAHFKRGGDHLAKLIYAQITDYSIASYDELRSAVECHRQAFFLDGPNDIDFIFSNDLIHDREAALYVDLIDNEGALEWEGGARDQHRSPDIRDRTVRLVQAIHGGGLISRDGFRALAAAWTGFDPAVEPHFVDWKAARLTRSTPTQQ
jgi:hypothetical protein